MNELQQKDGFDEEFEKGFLDFECQALKADDGRFVIDTDTKADWALAKINQANERKARIQQSYEERLRLLKAYVDKEMAKQDATVDFMQNLLKPYVEEQIADTNKKSIKFFNGTAGFRTVAAKIEVSDDKKLLAWVKKSLPEKVKVTESVAWGELKKEIVATPEGFAITKDGEKVEGVTVVSDTQKVFYVREGK